MVTTVTDSIRTRAERIFGFDASQYQGVIDWNSVKADGVKFAILRAYGSNHTGSGDINFEKYITQAKSASIPTGGYYFATPKNPLDINDVKQQADQFIAKLQNGYGIGKYGDLIPMLDVENNKANTPVGQSTLDISVTDLLKWVDYYRDYFEDKTGVQLGLYTNHYFIQTERNNFNEGKTLEGNIIKDMPLWMSAWTRYGFDDSPLSGGWTDWLIWQYSDGGVFAGIPENKVDLNIAKAPIEKILSKSIVPTEVLVNETTTETTTDTTQDTNITTTIVTTTTTTTTEKRRGKKYV